MRGELNDLFRDLRREKQSAHSTLYRATPADGQTPVAVRVFAPAASPPVRPELVALARARHPNLANITTAAVNADGHTIVASEWVDGVAVGASELGGEAVAQLAADVLCALSELHARGLVHGRVRPSAILATTGGARLVDFAVVDRDVDSPYSAPELTRHKDPRSDLYCLGAVLYRLLSGSPPFAEAGPARLAHAKLGSGPEPIANRAPAAPPRLLELITRLVVPNPGARPQSARDALEVLGADSARCRSTAPRAMFGAHLIGRDGAIGALEDMWWEAKAGRGGVALVTGELGSGTSRILDEICERVGRSGAPALRLDVDDSAVWNPATRAETADVEARFARHEAVVKLLARRTGGEPAVIVIDDAQDASASQADLLGYLARCAAAGNQLLVLASRPASARADAPAQRLREAVLRSERGRCVELSPLGPTEVHRVLCDALGEQAASDVSARAFAEHGGNIGSVAQSAGQPTISDELSKIPATSRQAVARLSVLAPRLDMAMASGLLRGDEESIAEVIADAIDAGILIGVPGTELFAFCSGAATACQALLESEKLGELHGRAAELLAETSEPAQRIAAHYFAAGADDSAIEWGLRAAENLAADCDHLGALDWYRRVLGLLEGTRAIAVRERIAELCLLVEDFSGAAEQLETPELDGAKPERRIKLLCRLARARLGTRDRSGAVVAAMSALDIARHQARGAGEVEAHLTISSVLGFTGDIQGALEHAVTGHLLATSLGDQRAIAELLRLRGSLESDKGDYPAAIAQLETASRAAESVKDEALQARVLHDVGKAAVRAGNYHAAVEALEKAALFFERTAHIVRLARSLNNLGAAYYYQGRWQKAKDAWERFRRLCERADERTDLVTALNNLGSLYRDLGELSDALTVLDRGTEIAAQRGNKKMSAMLLGNRGETLAKRGDYAAAAECYTRALAEFERLGIKADAIEIRRRLCELSLTTGRTNDALDRVVDIARDARDAGTVLEEGILHRVAASALRQQGDLESANWFADKAHELLSPLGARYELAKLGAERAAILAAQGDRGAADLALRDAMSAFQDLGARWDVARCRAQLRGISPAERAGELGATALLSELVNAPSRSSIDDLLASGLDRVLAQTRFGRGFILLLDPDGRPRQRVRRARRGSEGFDRGESEFSGSIVRRVAATGESVAITDIDETEHELSEASSVVALGLRQVMCAPMATRGRVIGTVYIDNRGDTPIDDGAPGLPLLEAFAAEASVVVENARLELEVGRKTELMAMLAHEIRNPLAGILGFSEIGLQSAQDKTRELFQRIRRDGERMRRLVDNVLELARHDAGKIDWLFEVVDMADLIEEVAESFRHTCETKQLELAVDTSALMSRARASADRIAQVLSNLINNAVKFTPEGGRITVTARTESVSRSDPDAPPLPASNPEAWGPIEPVELSGADYIRIDVTDTGPGMTEEIRANLFQKFHQGKGGKKLGKGVGLGLYISKEIVTRHAGSIWATSVRGQGSTFSFRVPVATDDR